MFIGFNFKLISWLGNSAVFALQVSGNVRCGDLHIIDFSPIIRPPKKTIAAAALMFLGSLSLTRDLVTHEPLPRQPRVGYRDFPADF